MSRPLGINVSWPAKSCPAINRSRPLAADSTPFTTRSSPYRLTIRDGAPTCQLHYPQQLSNRCSLSVQIHNSSLSIPTDTSFAVEKKLEEAELESVVIRDASMLSGPPELQEAIQGGFSCYALPT